MTARRIPTRPGLLRRAVRALRARWLLSQADAVRTERKQYEANGAAGPIYCRNSLLRELELRMRARRLDLGS